MLRTAIKEGNVKLVEIILKTGQNVDPNEMIELNLSTISVPEKARPEPVLVPLLLYALCMSPGWHNSIDLESLTWKHKHFQICVMLLEAGANPSWRSDRMEWSTRCSSIWHAALNTFAFCSCHEIDLQNENIRFLDHLYGLGANLTDFNSNFMSPLVWSLQ